MSLALSTIQQSENEDISIDEITQEIPTQTAAIESTKEVASRHILQASTMPSAYGPLSDGETLFSISKALDLPFKTTAQTAATIWLENPDQFILGNIHRIKKGAILNLGEVESSSIKFFVQSARLILNNHWGEWVGNSNTDKLEQRVIEWRQEGQNWKVIGEIFFEPDEEAPEWETSFVLYVSSHPYGPSA